MTREEVIDAISNGNSFFHRGTSTVHRIIRYDAPPQFLFGGAESVEYLNRTVAHHELLHVGQYLRNPRISDYGGAGRIHEVLPSFIGTPEIYGGFSLMVGAWIYGVWELSN